MSKKVGLLVIGVAECIDIPSWQVRRLPAKVDTGARTSALHVENLRELSGGRVRFDVPLAAGRPERRVTIEALVERRARVRSTSGEVKPRVFVTVPIWIGPVERRIELGLVDRRHMQFRMLIGRSALSRAFLVDVSKTYLLTGHPKTPRQRGLQASIAREERKKAVVRRDASRVVSTAPKARVPKAAQQKAAQGRRR